MSNLINTDIFFLYSISQCVCVCMCVFVCVLEGEKGGSGWRRGDISFLFIFFPKKYFLT